MAYAEMKRPLFKEKSKMSEKAARLGIAALSTLAAADNSSIAAQTREALQGQTLFQAKFKDRKHFKWKSFKAVQEWYG